MNELDQLKDLILDMNISQIRLLESVRDSVLRCETKQDLKEVAANIDNYIAASSKIIADN